MAVSELNLTDDGGCFGCGKNNPIGLKLDFEYRDGEYVAEFTPTAKHQGFVGVTHGGILATLVDEAMARMVWEEGRAALTAELSIRFKQPAVSGEPLIVSGSVDREEGKILFCKSEIRTTGGVVVAEATARMVRIMNSSTNNDSAEELVSVFRAPDETTANLVRGLLEGAGIEVTVASRQVPWMDGVMVSGEGYWGDVLTSEDRREESIAIIESYAQAGQAEEIDTEEQDDSE